MMNYQRIIQQLMMLSNNNNNNNRNQMNKQIQLHPTTVMIIQKLKPLNKLWPTHSRQNNFKNCYIHDFVN
jgi:hypothetical protein